MPANPVMAGDVLSGFIRTAFVETYERLITDVNARLGNVMDFGLPSDRSQEDYAYYTAAPHPRRWPRGEDIPAANFQDVKWTVVNYDWAMSIKWHVNDRMDDQLRNLEQRARDVAFGFALLRERVFFQILTGATDAALLPAVPTAPDGAAFFATTAAGAARFGVTNGNLLTGSGVASAQAIRNDIFDSFEQFHRMQDGEGQPQWPESIIDQGITVIYNVANHQVVTEALVQQRTLQTATVSSTGLGAAVTNIVLDSGMSVTLWPTQRITDNDIYVFLNGAPTASVFEQVRQELQDEEQIMANSDEAKRTKIEGLFWNARYGFGLALPYQAIKINN